MQPEPVREAETIRLALGGECDGCTWTRDDDPVMVSISPGCARHGFAENAYAALHALLARVEQVETDLNSYRLLDDAGRLHKMADVVADRDRAVALLKEAGRLMSRRDASGTYEMNLRLRIRAALSDSKEAGE